MEESALQTQEKGISVAISRDEMNLAEFPLAVLSTRVNSTVKTLEFRDSIRSRRGEVIEREWIITGADKFGLPTSTDDDVLLGLMRLTMDHGFRDRKVYFTRYELLKILRWTTEGRSYRRLTKSLDRLSGVRIKASNAFFDNRSKAFQTRNFGIIDAYEINDSRAGRGEETDQPKSFFIWSEVLFDSFSAGFIKKLDLDFYFTLSSSVARRLYRYLDKHFYYRSQIEKPLMTFAFEKLGLSRNYKYASSIKQQIDPALEELQERGFLSSYQYYGSGSKTMLKMVAARANQRQVEESVHAKESSTRTPAELRTFIELLVARGIYRPQAEKLLSGKSKRQLLEIRGLIAYFDYLIEQADARVSINPAGFLYRAVESPHKFNVPERFDLLKRRARRMRSGQVRGRGGEQTAMQIVAGRAARRKT